MGGNDLACCDDDDDDHDDVEDDDDDEDAEAHEVLGDTRVEETPKRPAGVNALPLPGSPQSVAAELVTTSPHFIGAYFLNQNID